MSESSSMDYRTIHELPPMKREDWIHLVDYGFAAGNYVSRCSGCQRVYTGMDKRAWQCYECAKVTHANYADQIKKFDLFDYTTIAAKICGNTKADQRDILASLVEEVGELAVEIKIDAGLKAKPHSSDGVVGEAIDTIIVSLDIIHSELGELNPETLHPIFKKKLDKWVKKYLERKA